MNKENKKSTAALCHESQALRLKMSVAQIVIEGLMLRVRKAQEEETTINNDMIARLERSRKLA